MKCHGLVTNGSLRLAPSGDHAKGIRITRDASHGS